MLVRAPGRIETERGAYPARDGGDNARDGLRVPLAEVWLVGTASHVKCPPGSAARDEGGAKLEGDARRGEQLPEAHASLGAPACRHAQDPHGRAPRRQRGEGVEVALEILARDDQLSGCACAVRAVDTTFDQLAGSVAGDEASLGVERVPAHRVGVDGAADALRRLGEELL